MGHPVLKILFTYVVCLHYFCLLFFSVDMVEHTRLESLLELALRTSAAKADPYHDNVRVELLPYGLMFQMCKILSIDTESEADFKKSAVNTSELTGLEAFAFGYDVQWPLSLILNRLVF